MLGTGTLLILRAILASAMLIAAVLCVAMESPVSAQNWGSSFFGFGTFETSSAPLSPPAVWAAAFVARFLPVLRQPSLIRPC